MKKYMTLLILFYQTAFSDCEPIYMVNIIHIMVILTSRSMYLERIIVVKNTFYPCVGMIECILLKRIMLTLLI